MREGYNNSLQEGEDVARAAQDRSPVSFRDREIDRVVAALARKRSVLLVGPPGVGKSAVVDGIALRLDREAGASIRRLSTTQIISGTRYLGEWQTKVTQLMSEAETSNTILNIVDVWNLPTVGRTAQTENSLFDAMYPWLIRARLRLVGEVTDERFHELMRFPNFASCFEIVHVEPPPGTADA